MPTKPTVKKPVRPVRKPIKPVKPMGSRPVVIVIVIVLVAIVGLMGYFLFKKPPAPTGGPSAVTSRGPAEGPSADTTGGGEAQMAVARARLQQETADNKAFIRVIIDKVTGTGGREVVYRYEWTLNGQPAGDSSDRVTGFKRGDRVAVKITPVEGDKPGQARFIDLLVNNMPPRIAESKQTGFDGKTFTYQVKGADEDGDTLSYALENAPQGMTINSQTGLVTWPVGENDYGERTFQVKIDDGKSGTAIHPVKVDIQKPAQEAKSPAEQK